MAIFGIYVKFPGCNTQKNRSRNLGQYIRPQFMHHLPDDLFLVSQKIISGGEQMISATSGFNPFEEISVKMRFIFSNRGVKKKQKCLKPPTPIISKTEPETH